MSDIIMMNTIPLLCENQEAVNKLFQSGFKLIEGDVVYLKKEINQENKLMASIKKFFKLHV